jgi:hypothetical protein
MMLPMSSVRLRTSSGKAQIMKLLITQSYPVHHCLVLLRPKYTVYTHVNVISYVRHTPVVLS